MTANETSTPSDKKGTNGRTVSEEHFQLLAQYVGISTAGETDDVAQALTRVAYGIQNDDLDVSDVTAMHRRFTEFATNADELWTLFTEMDAREARLLSLTAGFLEQVNTFVANQHGEETYVTPDPDVLGEYTKEISELVEDLEDDDA